MIKVGITGGIGSGKTTVCQLFSTLGIPIYDTDKAAKWLLQYDQEVRQSVEMIFGQTAYLPDGTLNRATLSATIFAQPEKRQLLEQIVHPAVLRHSKQWIEQQSANTPYILKESALLFESGAYQLLDKIITITAPLATRIQRVMQRDNLTEAAVQARIALQLPDEEKINRSHFIIYNDGTQPLLPQVQQIDSQLRQLITG